jgi:hypothetical protein
MKKVKKQPRTRTTEDIPMNARFARSPISKHPVDPTRIRRMPAQFAPVDRRLVYDQHLSRLTHPQMALYLFLHCVADAQGLSYYGEERIGQILNLSESALHEARHGLIERHLLLYHRPIYQLLDLPESGCARSEQRTSTRTNNGEAVPIGEVLQHMLQRHSL